LPRWLRDSYRREVSVGDFLQADALSAWLDLIIGFVGSSGTFYAVGYMGEEMDRGHLSSRRYSQFFCLFDLYLAAMLLGVNQENIAIMWIAIEGSTLAAALLIDLTGCSAGGRSYIILSAVGIALRCSAPSSCIPEHILGV
jgi:hydrogenase-4 component F